MIFPGYLIPISYIPAILIGQYIAKRRIQPYYEDDMQASERDATSDQSRWHPIFRFPGGDNPKAMGRSSPKLQALLTWCFSVPD